MTERLLAREFRHFGAIRKALQDKGLEGKWVCILGDRLIGVYDWPFDALDAGVGSCSGAPFLVEMVPKPFPSGSSVEIDKVTGAARERARK